jgi:hypothetical protein
MGAYLAREVSAAGDATQLAISLDCSGWSARARYHGVGFLRPREGGGCSACSPSSFFDPGEGKLAVYGCELLRASARAGLAL